MRSPPERSETCFCWSPPLKPNHETYWREVNLPPAERERLVPPEISFQTVVVGPRARGSGRHRRAAPSRRPQCAPVRLLLARDHAEEGGLARAVRPDDADDAAGRQREAELLDQEPLAVALGQRLGLDDEHRPGEAPAGCGSRTVELVVLLLGEQPLVGGKAGLGLGVTRASGTRAPTRARARSSGGGRSLLLLAGEARLLLLEPGRVVAR